MQEYKTALCWQLQYCNMSDRQQNRKQQQPLSHDRGFNMKGCNSTHLLAYFG